MVKRILVCSPKGGSGKSHLVRNLSTAATVDGMSVTTVDLDPQKTLSKWWGRRGPGLAQFHHYEAGMDDAADIVKTLTEGDILFIDTPPYIDETPEAIKQLIVASDLILIPTRPTWDDLESALPIMRLVRGYKVPAAFVLNAVKPRVAIKDIKLELNKTGTLCPIEIADRADYQKIAKLGVGIVETRNDDAAAEIRGIWDYAKLQIWQ